MNSVVGSLVLSFIAGCGTFVGVAVGSARNYGRRGLVFGTSFAAGIMVLISCFELIPESVRHSNVTLSLAVVIVGVAALWVLNTLIPHIHSVKEIEDTGSRYLVKVSYLLTVGLILHDFPEGFAIASSYSYATPLGLMVIIGLFIHNVPEGYTMTVTSRTVLRSGYRYRAAVLSTLSTVLGTAFGLLLIGRYTTLGPVFNSFAAGAMVFVAFHELLPVAARYREWLYFTAGLAASAAVYVALHTFL
ncbi:MAG: ZIP family metal transporter [Patescibacteria group bacterium]